VSRTSSGRGGKEEKQATKQQPGRAVARPSGTAVMVESSVAKNDSTRLLFGHVTLGENRKHVVLMRYTMYLLAHFVRECL